MMNKSRSFVSEGILIAVGPVLAYAVAFFFEKGYLSFYSLPPFLVKVSLESFFYALACIYTATYSLYFLVSGYMGIHADMEESNTHAGYTLLLLLITMCIAVLVIANDYHTALYLCMALALFGAYFYIPPFFKRGMPYSQALDAWIDNRLEARDRGLLGKARSALGGRRFAVLYFLVLILPYVSASIGYKSAARERQFLLTKIDGRDFVLLRRYDDLMLLVHAERPWVDLYHRELRLSREFILTQEMPETTFTPIMKKDPD